MAKGSSRRTSADAFDIANSVAGPIKITPAKLYTPTPVTQTLSGLLDRRQYRPDKRSAPPPARRRSDTKIRPGYSPQSLNFARPSGVALCQRRKKRRAVLFAKKLNGKGSGAKKRRQNFWSRISC